MDEKGSHRDDRGPALIGGVLIAIGLYLFVSRMVVVPAFFSTAWRGMRDAGWPLALIVAGAALIVFARDPRFTPPAKGTRLYRSRTQRMVSGVLGGVAEYLGVDVTAVRLAVVAAALLFGPGEAVVGYIVATFVVPEPPGQA
ncbi:MAG: PspC domain-containing protein [Coriobacteriia bacterium]